MADVEETLASGAGDHQDSTTSAKHSSRTLLLDSGEDFEMLENSEDDGGDDDLPPLEDAGGGEKKGQGAEHTAQSEDSTPQLSAPKDEWVDILGRTGLIVWVFSSYFSVCVLALSQ